MLPGPAHTVPYTHRTSRWAAQRPYALRTGCRMMRLLGRVVLPCPYRCQPSTLRKRGHLTMGQRGTRPWASGACGGCDCPAAAVKLHRCQES
eukprot:365443-Chlamydomonas_euryale.AAC.12